MMSILLVVIILSKLFLNLLSNQVLAAYKAEDNHHQKSCPMGNQNLV